MAATPSLLSIQNFNAKPNFPLQKCHTLSHSTPIVSFKSLSYPSIRVPRLRLQCSAVQEAVVTESGDGEVTSPSVTSPEAEEGGKRKLYVANLPWSMSGPAIKTLFSECGTVKDVEMIKRENGLSKGFAFVTMSSPEEAQAVIEKFNSSEVSGRTIKVEHSKRFRRPPTPPPEGTIISTDRHVVYVSNLAWKARSAHLRELFVGFNPTSVRVIFDNRTGRSEGYGFVAFSTKEEAEAAIAELDGKELMERPIRLKMSERGDKQSENEAENVAEESEDSVETSETVDEQSEEKVT
ncbi:28 kDa ribonucleoprotein, chloroplastic-like [Carex rostrata]